MFARAVLRQKFLILFGLIAVVFGISGTVNYFRLHESQSAWEDYLHRVNVRKRNLDQIQENLGYSGAIHHFKNFVLRSDSTYYHKFLTTYGKVVEGIKTYRRLDQLEPLESESLSFIENVAANYRQNLDKVAAMHREGYAVEAIDTEARVNDAPAIQAFQTLRILFQERTTRSNRQLSASIHRARRAMILGFVISALVLFVSFILISRSISNPLLKLARVVRDFASGRFDVQVHLDNKDEIGVLGNGFNAMATNVNKLVQSLQMERDRCERAEIFMKEVSSIASVGGWSLDIEKNQFTFTQEGCQIYGLPPGHSLEYGAVMAFYLPTSRRVLKSVIDDCLDSGRPWNLELELINNLGHGLWVQNLGEVDHEKKRLIGVIKDITAAKKTELALLEAHRNLELTHNQLASMINGTPDAIAAIDTDYRYLNFNEAFRQYKRQALGIEVAEGESLLRHLPVLPDVLMKLQLYWSRALNGESFSEIQQFGEMQADGIAYEMIFSPLTDSSGAIVGAVTVLHDITDRIKQDILTGQFISSVNHELRTPLTAIKGSLSLVQSGSLGALPDDALTMIKLTYRNSERLERLVSDLLDIQHMNEMQFKVNREAIALSRLLELCLENCSGYADQYGVSIEVRGRAPSVTLSLDPYRFQQVMDNLLSNACKFSPAGSVVQIYSWQEEGVVSIAVKDEGSGIPDSFKPFVFEKFRQGDASTSRNYPGTGLGLSISEHLVEQFDGTLTFESEIGVGTTFIVSLPVYEEYLLREIEAVPDQAVRDINGRCTPG